MSDQEPNKQEEILDTEVNNEEVAQENVEAMESVESEMTIEEQLAKVQAELAEAKAQIDAQKDSVVRAAADVDNIRRRSAQDVEKARKFALEKFVNELLPVIDNMERAIEFSDKENEALKPVLEGVELTQKSFIDAVTKFGVEVVNPEGEKFNAEFHQAMAMQPSADVEPNTVIAVMQKGFTLNGRLLRPAMVMVSKAAE